MCVLLEIHWGTVMSSCTSAHALVRDLDPDAIAITFDPANMVIEGKEDWEYGIELLRDAPGERAHQERVVGAPGRQLDLAVGRIAAGHGRVAAAVPLARRSAAIAACWRWKTSSCRARMTRRSSI